MTTSRRTGRRDGFFRRWLQQPAGSAPPARQGVEMVHPSTELGLGPAPLITGLLLLLPWLGGPACTSGRGPGDGPLGVGSVAPDFELPRLDGGTVRLSNLRGKVVLLNFWATWCPPCLEEMPSMERLRRILDRPDFVVLGVSIDEGGEQAVRDLLGDKALPFPVLLDAALGERRLISRTGAAYGITGVPETFVIDRNGYIVRHRIGPLDWSRADEVDYFRNTLDGS